MSAQHPHHHQPTQPAADAVRDPVCGMMVNPAAPRGGQTTYRGVTYSFCNPRCKARFEAEPERYLAPAPSPAQTPAPSPPAAPAAPAVSEEIYTCPMDPEVRQRGPGVCPKCGMALEPE